MNDNRDPRSVFVVHGRDHEARDALHSLLRALDLKVVSWRQAATWAGGGAPYTGDIVQAGMKRAQGVVVLLTPDDIGHLRPEFVADRDGRDEREPTGQPRMNVLFEAGMAMALGRNRVVIVEVGAVRRMTDIDGVNVVRLDGSLETRKDLAARLRNAGLAVDTDDDAWRTAGTFTKKTRSSAPAVPSAGGGSPKQEAYRFFWQRFLDHARNDPDGSWIRARGTRTENWMVLASHQGNAFVVSFSGQDQLRSEYYLGNDDAATNLRQFRALEAQRARIEQKFGGPLSWEELPGRKACRIATYRPGTVLNQAEHGNYAEWFLATANLLRAVFG